MNIDSLIQADYEQLVAVPEIGGKIAESIVAFFRDAGNRKLVDELKKAGLNMATRKKETGSAGGKLKGLTFVVSGVFQNYEREDLKALIKDLGGKVLSSISSKLDYLVTGENAGPAKLEMAKELGVKIISESEFEDLIKKS
jgi:DNA ligase (NAD+)